MSISLDPDLDREVRQAARRDGTSLSAWIAEAIAARLRREALDAFIARDEREFGPIPEDVLEQARRDMGYDT